MTAEYRSSIERKTMKVIKVLLVILLLSISTIPACRWFSEAEDVGMEQYGPKAMLGKYEWFINQNNAIQKMNNDILIYKKAHNNVKINYVQNYGEPSKWDLAIKTMYNKEFNDTKLTYISIVSQRNNLVKDYNSQSEKFNWSTFKTRTDCPPESIEEYAIE